MLTRKVYRAVALDVFNNVTSAEERVELAHALSTFFAGDNPRFDRVKFSKWCVNGPANGATSA